MVQNLFLFFSRHSWILQSISANNWGSHWSRHPVAIPRDGLGTLIGSSPGLCSTTKQKSEDYIKENRRVDNRIGGKSTDGKATKPTQETLVLSQCYPLPSNHSPSACRDFMGHPQHPTWARSLKPRSAHVRGSVGMRACSPALQLSGAS